eukprot:GEMP01135854.1.p1 GENE.GEMP01135854.1~~GEMP01135854.1.p1  ORF type:complete len:102 (-),score=2.53 GEMP01135854.1:24-329(-)
MFSSIAGPIYFLNAGAELLELVFPPSCVNFTSTTAYLHMITSCAIACCSFFRAFFACLALAELAHFVNRDSRFRGNERFFQNCDFVLCYAPFFLLSGSVCV